MPSDSPALLAPGPGELPLLFETSRLLGRVADPSEALPALLALLERGAGFRGGLAAASAPGGGEEPRIVAASDPGDAALLGRRLAIGGVEAGLAEGAAGRDCPGADLARGMGKALGRGAGHAAAGQVAAPALAGGRVSAVLGFRLAEGADPRPALALVEGAAALYAEALILRRLVAEAARREDTRAGQASSPAPAAPSSPAGNLAGSPAGGPAALAALKGNSPAMAEVRAFIGRVAPTESTVLLLGESGTGKELAARAIHELSPRAAGPFVAVNCAALPEYLVESELFGHERGAFTGAHARRAGRFELAKGGTLFFDEVGELGPAVQAKLLRALQERRFERVGGGASLAADVRVIAATNRDLEREVAAGRFRADLFFRLNVVPIRMPPLRERGADLFLLADTFALERGAALGKPVLRISTPALDLLASYHWPGNVRELENAVERAAVLSTDGVIHAYNLPPSLQSAASTGTGPASTLDASLARLERELLVEALKESKGNAAAAARSLDLSERRMGLALRKYGIDWRRFRTSM